MLSFSEQLCISPDLTHFDTCRIWLVCSQSRRSRGRAISYNRYLRLAFPRIRQNNWNQNSDCVLFETPRLDGFHQLRSLRHTLRFSELYKPLDISYLNSKSSTANNKHEIKPFSTPNDHHGIANQISSYGRWKSTQRARY